MNCVSQQGLTLPELLISLSLAAILLAGAAPAFSNLLQSSRNSAHTNELHSAVNFARAQAIQTRRSVSICSGTDQCRNSRRWQQQLLIFIDHNRDGQLDAGEQLLRTTELSGDVHWYWSNFRQRSHLTFKPDGTTHSLNGTFTLCRQQNAQRSIVINITGRSMSTTPSNALACTL